MDKKENVQRPSHARPIRSHGQNSEKVQRMDKKGIVQAQYLIIVAAAFSFSKEANEAWQQLRQVRPEVIS